MSRRVYALVMLLAVGTIAISGCILPLAERQTLKGSGNVFAREESFNDFDSVEVSHAFRVDITQSERFSVVVSVDDNLVQYLDMAKRGQTLVIGLKPDERLSLQATTMKAEVSMPELTGLDLSGASRVNVGGFRSDKDLDVELSGASSLRGDLEAGVMRFDVSGAGRVTLSGSAAKLHVDASGASKVDLSRLVVGEAEVGASGGSEVTVNATDQLDVKASGGSLVHYLGSATLETVGASGGASIRKW